MDDLEPEESADDKILRMAKDAYKADKDHWDPIYDKARDDLRFLSDEPGAMWNEQEYRKRTKSGRPALELDYLTQFVNQVQNNIRESERVIDVVPEGSDASIATATMLKGLLRQIQYKSDAVTAYETASMSAIKCSIGYIEVDHDYADNESFNQRLVVRRVVNPFLYYPDRNFQTINGMDQKHGTKLEKIKVKDFQKQYPKAAVVGFDADDKIKDQSKDEEILIAYFFVKETEEKTLTAQDGAGNEVSRTITKTTVCKYKLAGRDVLERATFPGEYIPIVPVIGVEAWEDGERKLHSLIRKAKAGQKGYNLAQSVKLETLMKQPQAGVIAPAGSVENYADDWMDPAKTMVLRYDTKDAEGNPFPAIPTKLEAPGIAQGFIEAANSSVNDIRASMGMYQANLGEQGQEVSGVAIKARTIQGDIGTYHFGANLVHSIAQVGRILIGAAPIVYDTPRIEQIIDEEDSPQLVGLNGLTVEGQEAIHNLKSGKYGVRVTVGASYTTRRQEAEKFYSDLVAKNPQLLNVMGDLLFKYSDFDGAQQLAARMKKVMNPNIVNDDDKTDPQVAMLTQRLQQAAEVIQQLQAQLKDKTTDQQIKSAAIASKHALAQDDQHLDLLRTITDAALTDRGLDIKEQGTAAEIVLAAAKQLQPVPTVTTQMQGVENQLPHTPANQGGVF